MIERNFGVARSQDRAVRDRFLQELRVVVFRRDVAVEHDVRVHIGEAGHHRSFRKIDGLDTCWRRAARRHRNNLVVFNHDDRVLNRRVALAVDQPAGADGDAFRRSLLLGGLAVRRQTHTRKKNRRSECAEHHSQIGFHGDLCPRRAQRVPQGRRQECRGEPERATPRAGRNKRRRGQSVSSRWPAIYMCSGLRSLRSSPRLLW